MSDSTAFSSSAEDAITRSIDVAIDTTAEELSEEQFDDYYDIDGTARWILKADYHKVALQFPDELLHHSVPIFRRLKQVVGDRDLYVLADTSYGSCCVDEVAAEHVSATAMVHYGYACMSQTSRLPVHYVFGKKPIDVDACIESVVKILPPDTSALGLRHDVAYTHAAESIARKLEARATIQVLYVPVLPNAKTDNGVSGFSSEMPSTILYIGPESLGLTNLLVTHATSTVYSYNPSTDTSRLESGRTNKLLMRRYAVVQKARDADVFGILVGTLGVASYLPVIKHLRNILKKAKKKTYTISVGRLNPAKLANFMEIECFVLVACPENSMIDVKDFLRPIVTPFELGIALQSEPTWTGKYVLDFEQLLAEAQVEKESNGSEYSEDEEQPLFSLVSGKYRQAKRYGPAAKSAIKPPSATSQALTTRDNDGALVKLPDSAAGEFLSERFYRGLDPRLGEDEPGVLEQGRTGRAAEYDDDHVPISVSG